MIVVIYYSSWSGGHVALSLTGLEKEHNIHISLYPPNRSVPSVRLHSIEFDGPEEATEIVVLPSEESCGYGLSEKAISDWWRHEYKPSYRLFGNNCASNVYQALRVGQEKSASLKNTALPYSTSIISYPPNIMIYAKHIIETLLKQQSVLTELYLKYAELKEYCRIEKQDIPYHQAVAFYIRLKQFNHSQNYCLMINRPFCKGIQNTLSTFKANLEKIQNEELKLLLSAVITKEDASPSTSILSDLTALTDTSQLVETDIEVHYAAFKAVADYLWKLHPEKKKELIGLFDHTIKMELLAPLHQYLSKTDLSCIKETERFKGVFQVLSEKIDDQQNPHKGHISKATDVVTALLGFS